MSNYEYPDAPAEDAPDEVKEAVERWREEVPEEVKEQEPLLYYLLGSGTPPYKMDKDDAEYIHEPQGIQRCANCEYGYIEAESGEMICSQIRGQVRANHWCRLWKAGEQYDAD